jgi:hypothetical protein
MKKSKIILGASAAVVALVGAFAFTSHNNTKFGTGTLYTFTAANNPQYTLKACVGIDQLQGSCATTTYYTFSSSVYHSKGVITPFVTR